MQSMSQADSDNITVFPTPPAPPDTIKIEDEYILRTVCEWKIARAKQEIVWAEQEQATLCGYRSRTGLSSTPMHSTRCTSWNP
jgi:hypothetical protein